MKLLALAACALLLTGCATGDYAKYAAAQENIAKARYQALQAAAQGGNETTKVAVAMAIALGGNGTGGLGLVAPKDPNDVALGWAGILIPGLTQAYSIRENSRIAITNSNNQTTLGLRQSDNATAAQAQNNNTMRDIATLITVPQPTIVTQPAPIVVRPDVVNPVVVDPVVVNQPAPTIVNPVVVQPTTTTP
jgi:hypothetical protein